jgi:cytochrome P450
MHDFAQRLEAPIVTPGPEGRRLRRAIARLDEQVQKMIDARRADPHPPEDLLTKLLRASDDEGARMSDKQVRDEVLTLFVAGHETTATALAWAIHCLCRNPAVYEAVEREVDALPDDPTYEDLPRLGLTLRVFKEALRLYPPVHTFGRQSDDASSLDGYALEREAVALICPYALHRRPDVWPDPRRFDPDRFLPEAEAKRPRLAWLPFGAGPRTCIGNHFAMMEGQLVLAKLLRDVRFTPESDEVPEPHATLRPRGGMPMRVKRRR